MMYLFRNRTNEVVTLISFFNRQRQSRFLDPYKRSSATYKVYHRALVNAWWEQMTGKGQGQVKSTHCLVLLACCLF